jgi:hypothetical protein
MMKIVMKEPLSPDAVTEWRCLLCREAIDHGIEANRMRHREPVHSRARVPGSPPVKSGKSGKRGVPASVF